MFAQEIAGGHERTGFRRDAQMGKYLFLVGDDTVDDHDLLRHLPHTGDTWILLGLLYNGFLLGTFLFLLRTHRERQQQSQ